MLPPPLSNYWGGGGAGPPLPTPMNSFLFFWMIRVLGRTDPTLSGEHVRFEHIKSSIGLRSTQGHLRLACRV